jgi:hypothetical protein
VRWQPHPAQPPASGAAGAWIGILVVAYFLAKRRGAKRPWVWVVTAAASVFLIYFTGGYLHARGRRQALDADLMTAHYGGCPYGRDEVSVSTITLSRSSIDSLGQPRSAIISRARYFARESTARGASEKGCVMRTCMTYRLIPSMAGAESVVPASERESVQKGRVPFHEEP